MRLLDRLLASSETRYGIDWYAQQLHDALFTYNGVLTGPLQTSYGQAGGEKPTDSFVGYVQSAYRSNGVVFACILSRLLVFSEARFQFRRLENGRPGDLFGTPALRILERPWPGGTTGDLLARMEQDVSLAGNFYAVVRDGQVKRLRPDWVTIIRTGEGENELTSRLAGYIYEPGGPGGQQDPVLLTAEEVAHYAPIPDPLACHRGMSWITPVLREIDSDSSATQYKDRFFKNAATPNMVVKFDSSVQEEKVKQFAELFRQNYEGVWNAYKTMFMGGGADLQVIGNSFEEIRFAETQGKGETRIAAAAGVPPVLVGLSEGLQAATYSNYGQARRRFADGTMRPLWRNAASSLENLVSPPAGSELWFDDRDIAFLREDEKDIAEIQVSQATSIKFLTESGYEPKSVIQAVVSDDMSKLQHTGVFSVQLQPPGAGSTSNDAVTTSN